ncbi:hypothetical protein COCON_G00070980 [Conger conger]|uniref:PiggyBac transposable element-derived protein 4 C-terminal zinc-finger domain-containing protein n=1 Tax=Conger conger TaxID=82655 RepID=A0A9Q1DTD1_CONCO|nr:hypothetical protein COCON_G00070980 [Conger conger]
MSEPAGDWHETAEPSTAAVGETAGPHPPERRVCRRVRSGKRPRLAGSVIRRRSPWPYRAASQPVGELRQASALQPMTRQEFQEELTAQLCRGTSESPPPQEVCMHMPVRISQQRDQSQKASSGCKTCIHCRESRHVYQLTPWQCNECQVPLCLIVDRNCFEEWHK